MPTTVYFATNRNYQPEKRKPGARFGARVSTVHAADLRFGTASVGGTTNEPTLGKVQVADEDLNKNLLGSTQVFDEIYKKMSTSGAGQGADTLLFLHGYNVTFEESITCAGAVARLYATRDYPLNIAAFSWPSDGAVLMPDRWSSGSAYWNDRDDAQVSAPALGRTLKKLRDRLVEIDRNRVCGRRLHLLVHSMGAYLLRHALQYLIRYLDGGLSRIFDHVLLMAGDEDADAFDHEYKLRRLPEIARHVTVYFNEGDSALATARAKQNVPRLGLAGPTSPHNLPANVTIVDTSGIVPRTFQDTVEHSYFYRNRRVYTDARRALRSQFAEEIDGRRRIAGQNRFLLV